MRAIDIQTACEAVANETGLPVRVVTSSVYRRAGRPCVKCDGTGEVGQDSCDRCSGTGGPASASRIAEAADWVRANVDAIRQRSVDRRSRIRDRICVVEDWKREHPAEWAFLEDMLDCEVKRAFMRAIRLKNLSSDQAAWIQSQIQHEVRQHVETPDVGTRVNTTAYVNQAKFNLNRFGQRVFTVDFTTQAGWRGRVDVSEEDPVIPRVLRRRSNEIRVSGIVAWKRSGFAILTNKATIE